ncbi:hypothetical protein [Desulfotomaculum copahuensis]|nr:hypothetical protein [Desulfotomaculum copahuensis]
MFFSHWWQGIVFGFFTTVVMLGIGYFFTAMWDKYEEPKKAPLNECEMHH